MYDWPETAADTDRFWQAFSDGFSLEALRADMLRRPGGENSADDLWRDPDLLLGQTCWGPLYAGLSASVRVLAQPDYSAFEGGRGVFYRSAIVGKGAAQAVPEKGAVLPVRAMAGKRLAFNEAKSLSGWLALEDDMRGETGLALDELFSQVIETGSHRASIRAVAEDLADFAAIDCRTWAIAEVHEPAAKAVDVVGWTAERLGLPYICSPSIDGRFVAEARRVLAGLGAKPV